MSGRLLIAFILLIASGPSLAQTPVTAVAGAGSRSCEQMRADIADLPNTRRAYVSWMQGSLSGRNAAREAAGQTLVDIADYEAQWDWIVGWCADRPERLFAEAVGALFDDRTAESAAP
jgi:hypothetical protein